MSSEANTSLALFIAPIVAAISHLKSRSYLACPPSSIASTARAPAPRVRSCIALSACGYHVLLTSVMHLVCHMQAAVVLLVCVGLTALLPILEYVLILRHDSNVNIAFAAAIWAGCGMVLLVGLWAYHSMTPVLLGGHAALTCIAGSAMVVTYTTVYYTADVICAISQATITGCSGCPCAATNTCDTVRPCFPSLRGTRLVPLQLVRACIHVASSRTSALTLQHAALLHPA